MTKNTINSIQEYLTVVQNDGKKKYQIVNIELLLRRHPPEAVISFLDQLHKDYAKKMKTLIRDNRTSPELNDIIAKKFRVKMAINSIRNYINQEAA